MRRSSETSTRSGLRPVNAAPLPQEELHDTGTTLRRRKHAFERERLEQRLN